MAKPFINILTRTHREEKFAKCLRSIEEQDYTNYRHLLCIDDDDSLSYIHNREHIRVTRSPKKNFKHFPYNLYFNQMYKEIEDGWIIFLDDDDCFYAPDSLSSLASSIEEVNNIDALFLWKVWAPARSDTIPNRAHFSNTPKHGQITGQGFCFHKSNMDKAQWDNKRGGDFRVITRLYENLSHIEWVDKTLTSFQGKPGSI